MMRYLLVFLFLFETLALARELEKNYNSTQGLGRGNALTSDAQALDGIYYNPAGQNSNSEELLQEFDLISPQFTASKEIFLSLQDNEYLKSYKLNSDETIRDFSKKGFHAGAQNFTGVILSHLSFGILSAAHSNVVLDLDITNLNSSRALAEIVLLNSLVIGSAREIYPGIRMGLDLRPTYKIDQYYDDGAENLIEKYLANKDLKVYDILNKTTGAGVGIDLGFLWEIPGDIVNTSFGLAIFDLGNTTYRNGVGQPRPDKQQINIGSSLKHFRDAHTFTGSFDIYDLLKSQKESSNFQRLHFGLKWDYQKMGGILLGINQGYPSAGWYLAYRFISVEFSHFAVEYGRRPGDIPSLRESLQLKIGYYW